ncbi:hypothetical protein TCE0_022f06466 [Talaromyces pinophilus]|uniref:SH3 domain-containing protein n=1 Tax=Talaromyces pinophilus TaxID=128442 RepID=A0A6V8H740_TALPI|nr:hypothetical protein TCE0_022f06466 [Talaromyces pinophilus]
MSDPPFTVKALFDYTSEHEDDLRFSIGQVITVTAVEDADWYYGEYTDEAGSKQEGIFPRNFVERFEPTAPPRPSRPVKAKKEADPAPPPAPPAVDTPAAKEVEEEPIQEEEPEPTPAVEPPQEKAVPLPSPPPPAPVAEPVVPPVVSQPPKQPQPEPSAPAAKAPPPAVSSKPSSNAFRDRIAAFNKPAAPPIAPFKPGGPSSNTFIKKPFVAPPPSKNAYVPIPREQPPPKAYRREEDPEIANREPPVSEHSLPSPPAEPAQDEDQPKPTSLKERIALLQKQQLEQANRLAEAAQKKEKAKRPPKKRTDIQEAPPVPTAAESTELEHTENLETPRGERPSFEGEGAEDVKPAQLASPPLPSRELTSDTNDADYSGAADTEDADETSTSREDVDERPRAQKHAVQEQPAADSDEEAVAEDEEEEEEEEEVDPEVRRRMELRERMAKMSGGMGMMGMFGGGGGGMGMGMPPRKPKAPEDTARQAEELEPPRSPLHAPPVPIMALPGMNVQRPSVSSPKEVEKEDEREDVPITQKHSAEELPDVEDVVEEHGPAPRKSVDRAPPPPPPQERSVPPLPSTESRPPPPPVPGSQPAPLPPAPESRPAALPPRPPTSPSPGSESDDELSIHTNKMSLDSTLAQAMPASPPPPPRRSSTYDSVRSATMSEKRFSRGPPPIPTNPPQAPSSPPQARPPPPPPPGVLTRQATSDSRHSIIHSPISRDHGIQDETTEYEADYDTDIAPTAKHKDALKSHGRESSTEDGGDELSPQSPRGPPPLPPAAPRAVPPPLPPSQPPNKRASMDIPRSAPPPPPPARDLTTEEEEDDDEYDPYRYDSGRPNVPPPPLPSNPPPPREDYDDQDDSPVSLPQAPPPPPPPERTVAPPPPPHEKSVPPPPTEAPRSRQSLDISRAMANTRRSMDIPRPSVDMGFIATDVDLAESTFWWTQPNIPPPVFQNRKDLLFEIEESTSSKRGGKTTVSKDVYVLFADYSQTVINVRFDAKNPSDVTFEQRHEAPPSKLRQEQLEAAHEKFGSRISAAASSVQNTTVGDGTSYGLIQHLLSPLSDVLLPVGTRAYGALVYANLANASVQQNDEIRAGDIISFRNAKFQGHKGGLHQKYSAEVGKPDHVGVIVDWDGTKKKIHAWEQGRESKKVKPESFKLGDLKSGEVKVWRVMPRSWIGWDDDK